MEILGIPRGTVVSGELQFVVFEQSMTESQPVCFVHVQDINRDSADCCYARDDRADVLKMIVPIVRSRMIKGRKLIG